VGKIAKKGNFVVSETTFGPGWRLLRRVRLLRSRYGLGVVGILQKKTLKNADSEKELEGGKNWGESRLVLWLRRNE